MKKIKLLFAFLCFSYLGVAQPPTWQYMTSGALGNGMAIIPGTNKIITSASYLYENPATNGVAILENGGASWKYTKGAPYGVKKFFFLDSLNGFLINDSLLYESTDGGNNWSKAASLNQFSQLNDMLFFNKDTGFICGVDKFNRALIVKTYNAGFTWASANWFQFPTIWSSSNYTSFLGKGAGNNLLFFDSQNGCMISNNYANTWTYSTINLPNVYYFTKGNVIKLQMVDDLNGFLLIWNGLANQIGGSDTSKGLCTTTDGGNTWNFVSYTGAFNIFFKDKNYGVELTGGDGYNGFTNVISTHNGGQTWDAANPIENSYGIENLLFYGDSLISSVYYPGQALYINPHTSNKWYPYGLTIPYGKYMFFDNDAGFVRKGSQVYSTYNGGKSWSGTLYLDTLNNTFNFQVNDFYVTGSSTAYAVGNVYGASCCGSVHFNILKSTNRGKSWARLNSPDSMLYSPVIYCQDSNKVWMGGYKGKLYYTSNGGQNWQHISSVDSTKFTQIKNIYFVNSSIGFLIGVSNNPDYQVIYRTADSGSTWTQIWLSNLTNSNIGINFLSFVNDSVGFMCDDYCGYKTIDKGVTWHSFSSVDVLPIRNNLIFGDYNGYLSKSYDLGNNWQPVVNNSTPRAANTGVRVTGCTSSFLEPFWFTNDTTACIGNIKLNIAKTQLPVAYFSPHDTVYCLNESIHLIDSSWYNNSRTWYINGVNVGNSVGLNQSLTTPGNYVIKLVVSNLDGKDSIIKTIHVTPNTYTVSPSNKQICQGAATYFTVHTTGTGFTYQWRSETINSNLTTTYKTLVNDTNYSGVNSDTLKIVHTPIGYTNTSYVCNFTGCHVDSLFTGNLTVIAPASFLLPVASKTVCPGSTSISFSVSAQGTNLTYQWQLNSGAGYSNIVSAGINYSGMNTATLSIINVNTAMNDYAYRCIVSNFCNTDTSNDATLTIITTTSTPSIITQPHNDSTHVNVSTYFDLTAAGPGTINYQWEVSGIPYSFSPIYSNTTGYVGVNKDTLNIINPSAWLDGNLYRCRVRGGCGLSLYSDTVQLTVLAPLVWPGDADENLTVNGSDLLPIGIKFGQPGYNRATISNSWQGYACYPWYDTLNTGENDKFIDCNGDGAINMDDTLAIDLNYGLTHPLLKNIAPQQNNSISSIVSLTFNKPVYNPGDTVWVDIGIGDSVNYQTNFYGAAFNINYDNSMVKPGSEQVWFINSWLGFINQEFITFSHIMPGLIDMSLVQTTKFDISGYGKIATFQFVLPNVITTNNILLTVSNGIKTDHIGIYTSFNSLTDSAHVTGNVDIVGYNQLQSIHIYPNPTQNNFIVKVNSIEKQQLQLLDISGKQILQQTIAGTTIIETSQLENGVYFIQLKNNNGTSAQKIIVQH